MAALTNQQMNDALYLTSLINNLNTKRTDELRQNEMTTQQNMRRLREANTLNGINGGFEESNYARLLAGQNAARANIATLYDPQIAEYQSYLDRLAANAGGGGSRSRRRRKGNSNDTVPTVIKPTVQKKPTYATVPVFGQGRVAVNYRERMTV